MAAFQNGGQDDNNYRYQLYGINLAAYQLVVNVYGAK
jgi:hypothetical protein